MTEEQLAMLSEQTDHAVRKALRMYTRRTLAAFVALVLAGGYAAHQNAAELRDGLLGSCQRVNVLRAQSNLSDVTSFNVLSAAIRESRRIIKDPETTDAIRTARRATIKRYNREASRLTLTDLTECDSAVDAPREYLPAVARPIGNPMTGEVNPWTRRIVHDSVLAISRNRG